MHRNPMECEADGCITRAPLSRREREEQAKFRTGQKELSAFAEKALHAHTLRSDEIKAWRSSFGTEPRQIVLPTCAQSNFAIAPQASDKNVLNALIAHRQCALTYANDAAANVKSKGALDVLNAASRTFSIELQQLHEWSVAWK
ncbi:MAG TPA: hypothetical protein VNM92_12795 [Thermoanaerobaculia bacterium]|nr:hypothetical protein [Thermoanaerobaculia bacterium]